MTKLNVAIIIVAGLMLSGVFCDSISAEKKIRPDFYNERYGNSQNGLLDVYFPRGVRNQANPCVVWIHGGGFCGGSKDNVGVALKLLECGYVVVSLDYTLSTERGFPAGFYDCRQAIRYLRKNADRFHIDPDRIGVWGSSAGGNLASMLGTAGDISNFDDELVSDEGISCEVSAVCNWFGPADFSTLFEQLVEIQSPQLSGLIEVEELYFDGPPKDNPEKVIAASPVTYVDAGDPPFLIQHGEKDFTVPVQQSIDFARTLKEHGVNVELVIVKNVAHGFKHETPAQTRKVIQFFDAFLK